jgi:chemotaxis methyl-accepting protein methylase
MTVRDAVSQLACGEPLRVCILGCSTGAEVYSVLYTLRKALPDLKILPVGVDISESAIEKAKAGHYLRDDPELRGALSEQQLLALFDIRPGDLEIKQWIAEAIDWRVGDASDAGLRASLDLQHIVFANNFLVHMKQRQAAACLRNMIQLVKPGGLFVCRGVDLDVRQRAVREFRLEPIATRLEEIHNSEAALDAPHGWPFSYWGLEPLDKTRPDWVSRYAAVYRVPA